MIKKHLQMHLLTSGTICAHCIFIAINNKTQYMSASEPSHHKFFDFQSKQFVQCSISISKPHWFCFWCRLGFGRWIAKLDTTNQPHNNYYLNTRWRDWGGVSQDSESVAAKGSIRWIRAVLLVFEHLLVIEQHVPLAVEHLLERRCGDDVIVALHPHVLLVTDVRCVVASLERSDVIDDRVQ